MVGGGDPGQTPGGPGIPGSQNVPKTGILPKTPKLAKNAKFAKNAKNGHFAKNPKNDPKNGCFFECAKSVRTGHPHVVKPAELSIV